MSSTTTPRPQFHSESTLKLLQYKTVISISGIAVFTLVQLQIQKWLGASGLEFNGSTGHTGQAIIWTIYCPFLISVFLPVCWNILGFCLPLQTTPSRTAECYPRKVRKLYICLVTRGSNKEAVIRSCEKMRHLNQLDSRIQLCIATDQPHEKSFLHLGLSVISTPASFRPKKALYKARALEWFRLQVQLYDDDWVLHLDEETVIDDHTVKACLQFAEMEISLDFGQGIILYNTFQYWNHILITGADICRCRDDLGKFYLAHSRFHVPVFGVHGSFLLVRGKVENEVGWDSDSLVEDFQFSLQAWSRGYRGGWIPSIAREQSPMTLVDFCKQRRRWFTGMWRLSGVFGKISCFQWCGASFAYVFIYIGKIYGAQVPYWAYIFMTICSAADLFTLLFACVIQDFDAQVSIPRRLKHLLMLPLLSIAINMLDMSTIIYSIMYPAKGFHVVVK